ncbi:DUF2312 domain-containing protein [Azospirillaceae bacterium]
MSIGQNTAAAAQLKSFADRIASLLDQMDALKDDLKDLRNEAKSAGFNVKALDKLVAIRRKDGAADKETELLNDLILYAHATGVPLDLAAPEEDRA